MPALTRATLPLPLRFFNKPAEVLARDLLGTVLRHGPVAGMIVETEAYLPIDDLAAHSARGLTERTRVIFGPPGRAYVYLIYGIYECLNVVADRAGIAGCVLIRGLEPLAGVDIMRERRGWKGALAQLTNGPGKLTRALSITRADYGRRLDRGDLCIRAWREEKTLDVAVTPRIGITQCADLPLRFVVKGHE